MIRIVSSGFLLLFVTLCLITACNNNEPGSPYDEILSKQPYAGLTDSIKSEPVNAGLYFRRAILLNKNNFPEPALADFRKAWSLSNEEKYALGISNILLEKNPDSAAAFIQIALQKLPESYLLKLSLAHAYDAKNKTEDALKICDEILMFDPNQLDALLLKSDLLEKKQDINGSIVALEKAYSLAPQLIDINYKLAFKYAENKNSKVIGLCDSLIKKDSLGQNAEPFYFKGVYYYNIDNKIKALEMFDLAIQHDYNFLDAYLEKGRILFELKKYNDAFRTFQLAATITPTFADAWYWMGKCQEAIGNNEEAKLNYQRAYGLDKTLTEAKEAADKLK